MLYLFSPVENWPGSFLCSELRCLDRIASEVRKLLIIGEIVSFKDEKDRYRVLLQALARLVFALLKSGSAENPFIVAVYLTRHLTDKRLGYIVMKLHSESDEVVHRLSIKAILYIFLTFLFRARNLILLKKMMLLFSSARCTTSHPLSNALSINQMSRSEMN